MHLLMISPSCAYYCSIQETLKQSDHPDWDSIFGNVPLQVFISTSVDHFVITASPGSPAAQIVCAQKLLTVWSSAHQFTDDFPSGWLVKTLSINFTKRPGVALALFIWVIDPLAPASNQLYELNKAVGREELSASVLTFLMPHFQTPFTQPPHSS